MKTTTTNVQLADGFAMSRVRGAGALAGWRHVQAFARCMQSIEFPVPTYALPVGAASDTATRNAPHNPAQPLAAQPLAIAALPVVKTAAVPVTTKQHLVTTKGAGRGNKGSSPWKFPV